MSGGASELPVVETVSVELCAVAPGVTVPGLNEQLVPGGKGGELEQLSATALVNGPYCDVTVTV